MDRVVALDPAARTVTVEAGMSYGQLCPYLHEKGFALHNLASLPHISVAGAAPRRRTDRASRTGTWRRRSRPWSSSRPTAMSCRSRATRTATRSSGAVVNLGALGVVTKVTLDIQPTFPMRQDVYENLPLSAAERTTSKSIMSSGYSVSLFTDWQNKRINEVWVKRRVEKGAAADRGAGVLRGEARDQEPPPDRRTSRRRTARSRWGCPAPGTSGCLTSAWGSRRAAARSCSPSTSSPARNAVEAILAIERLRDRVSPHLMISELRTIDADQLWMSPSHGRPSLAIHFTWKPDWDAVRKLLPMIEKELAPYEVRPHWGKLFTLCAGGAAARYEKLGDFKELAAQYDPKGKFRNEFLARNLYGA